MKNLKLSMITVLAINSLLNAGGDLIPVKKYQIEDVVIADEYIEPTPEPVVEEYVAPKPEPVVEEYVAPKPEPVVEEYVAPEPEPVEEYVAPEPVEEYVAPKPVEEYVPPKPVYIKPKPVVTTPSTPVIKAKKISPSGFYAGLGITGAKYKDNCKCKNDSSSLGGKSKSRSFKDTTYGAMARVGYDINQYIGCLLYTSPSPRD